MPERNTQIPRLAVRRLSLYLDAIRRMRGQGSEWISSQELADALELTSSTVRQDLSHVDFSGISKRGYEASGLEECLAAVLGADSEWNVVVVGAGNLGRALALHEEFRRRGFNIRAVFDSDEAKAGSKVGGLVVQNIAGLAAVTKKHPVDVGIIAVPAPAAQEVADALVKAGVRGLLNLSPAHVLVSEDVAVVDARIVESLQELAHRLVAEK